MNIEKELQRITEEYRAEGYTVIIHPQQDYLEDMAVGLRADILAVRRDEKVLVQVKRRRRDVEADADLPLFAAMINQRPGWRFDLIVLEIETPVQRVTEKAEEPTDEQFREMLDRARLAKRSGLNEMAVTHAWAALEAAMRKLRDDPELYGRTTPSELLCVLYGDGFISRREFDRAKAAWTFRTQAVHGFVTQEIDPFLIDDILTLAKKVKGVAEMAVSPAPI